MTKTSEHRIVVIGAGYAGMMATLRAARRARRQGARVTLVNESEQFVERIRLHQVAAGQRRPERPIARMLRGTGTELIVGRVMGIDLARHELTVQGAAGETRVPYDTLVYALGSGPDTSTVPGAREHTMTLSGAAPAEALHARLAALPEDARVAVVGGGLTGIEASTEMAESYPGLHVVLVTREELGAALSQRGRTHLRRVLTRQGVGTVERTEVTSVRADALETSVGAVPFDLCLWLAGMRVPTLAREAGLAVNERGQVLVDSNLRSISHPEVYAAGDAAAFVTNPGAPMRMACATALPMGVQVGDNVAAAVAGEEPQPFSFAYTLQCISLGRHDALVQFVRPDDTPKERVITGRAATWVKEMICRSTVMALQAERRGISILRWPRWHEQTGVATEAPRATPAGGQVR